MLASPEYIIKQFELPSHAHIADIGAGTGHYVRALSRDLIKDGGKLFAIDVQKELLETLKADAEKEGFDDIHTIWGNVEKKHGTHLRDESIDGVVLANTLFQIEDKDAALREIARILKPGGHLYIVEWSDSFNGMGPRKDDIILADEVRSLCSQHDLVYQKDIDAGEHHYGLIFHK